jgi:1-acyl-sn-glycerol-3-phosphate acyltransferase
MQRIVLQLTYKVFVKAFLKVIVGVKFHSARFLLQEKQFIIVANHNSHLDTMAIMASIPTRIIHNVRPVAAADHFGKTKMQARLSNFFINTLLIKRKRDKNNPSSDPINLMIQAIDQGYSLIIFPEGTRGSAEVQQPLKPGVAYVLRERPHVKYVPVYLKGMGKAMPKHDSLIVPFNSSLKFGRLTSIESTTVDDILKQIEKDLQILKNE